MTRLGRLSMLIVLLAATCCGCQFANSRYPAVKPSEAKPAPKLHGAYRFVSEKESSASYLHLGGAGPNFPPGFLRIVGVGTDPERKGELGYVVYVGFVHPLESGYLVHLPSSNEPRERWPDWTKRWGNDEDITGYCLQRLTERADGFDVSSLDHDFLAAEIDAGRLKGDVERRNNEKGARGVMLTAPTKELAAYFAAQKDPKLFSKPYARLIRIADDVPAKQP